MNQYNLTLKIASPYNNWYIFQLAEDQQHFSVLTCQVGISFCEFSAISAPLSLPTCYATYTAIYSKYQQTKIYDSSIIPTPRLRLVYIYWYRSLMRVALCPFAVALAARPSLVLNVVSMRRSSIASPMPSPLNFGTRQFMSLSK